MRLFRNTKVHGSRSTSTDHGESKGNSATGKDTAENNRHVQNDDVNAPETQDEDKVHKIVPVSKTKKKGTMFWKKRKNKVDTENDGKRVEEVVDSSSEADAKMELRTQFLKKMINTVKDIEKTKRIIRNIQEGRMPNDGIAETFQSEKAQEKLAILAQKFGEYEKKVFEKHKEADGGGIEAYSEVMQNRLLVFKQQLEKTRVQEHELMVKAKQKVGHDRVLDQLKELSPFSKMRFLQFVIRTQARFRANRVRERNKIFLDAVCLIQGLFRKYRLRKIKRAELTQEILKRKTAVTQIQRFVTERNLLHQEKQKRVADNLSLQLKSRAAARIYKKKLNRVVFTAWREYATVRIRARNRLQNCVDRWYMERVAFAFKLWWVSVRSTYEVKMVGNATVMKRSLGAPMKCVHIYNKHYLRTSNGNQLPYKPGTWKDMTIIDQQETKASSPKNNTNATSKSNEETAVLPETNESTPERRPSHLDWSYPAQLSKLKHEFHMRHLSQVDHQILDAFKKSQDSQQIVDHINQQSTELQTILAQLQQKRENRHYAFKF